MTDDGHALPKLFADLSGWYAMTALAVGARTGLLPALEAGGTVEEIGARAGADPRNTLEWLRVLTAAGHAVVDEGRFSISPETAMVMGPDFPIDARAIIDFAAASPATLDDVTRAVQAGGGVGSAPLHAAFGDSVGRINGPTYAVALLPDWVAGLDGMSARLQAGGAVADLACGSGSAAALLADAYPQSTVVGFDLHAHNAPGQPPNLDLRSADVSDLPDERRFDLAVCLDSFHHFGDPERVAKQAQRILRPGGVFMVAEPELSGDLATDTANPFAVILFASSLLYCLQEHLGAGGPGRSPGDGPAYVMDALEQAGFRDVAVRPSEMGFHIVTGTA